MSLKNKIAIITGASRGIGKAIAQNLAKDGVHVILTARNQQDLNEAVESIGREGGKATAFSLDISDEKAVGNFIDQIKKITDSVDILINNAGIGSFAPVTETETQFWDQVMDVNVKGTFLMCKHLVPVMQKQKHGHIVNIASDVAKRTFAEGAMYCASKYAQDAFSSALRKEVRQNNIKVSVVYPGKVETYFNNSIPGVNEDHHRLHPDDIAGSVNYILSAPLHVVIDELMIHPISQDY
ncbi:SDR family oxidoreductase [Daejeonella oryzae]|uniref:SDR family oxidoreductase n=1 Tax=Daejeonella oryzae TaxID=1122943 RepID=UPI00041B8A3B|nr:SDR family oxidoreductase [Daejeonella oryzae]